MKNQGFRHRRGFAPVASLVLAIAAMLAIAAPASAHHHDFGSDQPTGTISSFDPDSGVLTIDLSGGGQVSGLVTDETRIETGNSGCHHGDDNSGDERRGRRSALRHGSGHDHGWHHGWWHHGNEGSSDDLVPGAVVDDAVLVLADGQATFVKIDLADSSDSQPTTSKAKASRTRH